MLASSAIVVGLLAAFSGFAAASPVPQANSLPGSTDEVCFPCAADFDTYIQAFNSSNRLVVGDNAREASPVTSLAGGQTKWRIERTGSEPNEGVIKLSPGNEFLLQPGKAPDVELGLVGDATPQTNPIFRIGCHSCNTTEGVPSSGTLIGTNCNIISVIGENFERVSYLTQVEKPGGEGEEGFVTLSPLTLMTNQLFHVIAV